MKGLAESSPFHLLTNPHMINRFIFGHGVVIYYIFHHLPYNKQSYLIINDTHHINIDSTLLYQNWRRDYRALVLSCL